MKTGETPCYSLGPFGVGYLQDDVLSKTGNCIYSVYQRDLFYL